MFNNNMKKKYNTGTNTPTKIPNTKDERENPNRISPLRQKKRRQDTLDLKDDHYDWMYAQEKSADEDALYGDSFSNSSSDKASESFINPLIEAIQQSKATKVLELLEEYYQNDRVTNNEITQNLNSVKRNFDYEQNKRILFVDNAFIPNPADDALNVLKACIMLKDMTKTTSKENSQH